MDISKFNFTSAKTDTIFKGEQIYLDGKIKKIDENNYVICGSQEYEVSINTDEKTIECTCQGYFRYLYCKHSIALAVHLNKGKRV